VEGTKTADGTFWPEVKLEVRKGQTGKWKRIAISPAVGRPATVTIKPNTTNFDLAVNLDDFKRLIGTCEFGRIVLKTGQASVFELKDLAPSEQETEKADSEAVEAYAKDSGIGNPEKALYRKQTSDASNLQLLKQKAKQGDTIAAERLSSYYSIYQNNRALAFRYLKLSAKNNFGGSQDARPQEFGHAKYELKVRDEPERLRFLIILVSKDTRDICIDRSGWPDSNGKTQTGSDVYSLRTERGTVFPHAPTIEIDCWGTDCMERVRPGESLEGVIAYSEFDEPAGIRSLRKRELHVNIVPSVCEAKAVPKT
jgi:hypothetical protein